MPHPLAAWLDLLRCPADESPLRPAGSTLACATCGGRYPAEGGIVRFVQADGAPPLDDERKVREMAARDEAAPVYTASFDGRWTRLEGVPSVEALAPAPGDVVCELGAGTGRVTLRYAGRVARVVALDFSLRCLEQLRQHLPASARPHALLVQADACRPPLAAGAFDKVGAFGLLHHLPTDAMRRQAVRSAARLLAPGGTFTAAVYHWSRQKRAAAERGHGDWTRKQGLHDSGICYYNFEEPEVRDLWRDAGLRVDRVLGLQIGFRGARLLGPLQVPVNRLLAGTAWGIARSHQLLVRGVREPG